MGRTLLLGLVLLCFTASLGFAVPLKPLSPLDTLETFNGRVDLVAKAHIVKILLTGADRAADRWFQVELSGRTAPLRSFSADPAQILFWRGNLVVIVPGERKALHFSVPGFAPGPKLARELDDLLDGYNTTRIETATAIISRSGPQLEPTGGDESPRVDLEKTVGPFYQSPGGGVGDGGCGTSCSQSCADGSSCSVTCGPNRCAHCSCPASCSCT
jgi:hypothetical protein